MNTKTLNLLVLGRGKTGALVAGVARERGHSVRAVGATENVEGRALASDAVSAIDVVIDFTTPHSVMGNVEAAIRAGKNIVVGTTGWYGEMDRVFRMVQASNVGFVFGANFSIGVNVFFEIAQGLSASAVDGGYDYQILERHHIHKKDAPSGTAARLRDIVSRVIGAEVPITSEREGEVVGYHELILDSAADTITLAHNAKSRRGFAEGAVRAAEWVVGRKGFYDFKDVWRDLR